MSDSPFSHLKEHQKILESLLPHFGERHLFITPRARTSTSDFLFSLATVIDALRETNEGKKVGGLLEILTTQRHTILFELQVYQRTLLSSPVAPRKELETRDWLSTELGALSRRMHHVIDELDLIWPINQS